MIFNWWDRHSWPVHVESSRPCRDPGQHRGWGSKGNSAILICLLLLGRLLVRTEAISLLRSWVIKDAEKMTLCWNPFYLCQPLRGDLWHLVYFNAGPLLNSAGRWTSFFRNRALITIIRLTCVKYDHVFAGRWCQLRQNLASKLCTPPVALRSTRCLHDPSKTGHVNQLRPI